MNPFSDEDNQEYVDQTFRDLNQQQTILQSKRFDNCTFVGCTFRESKVSGCVLVDCSFKKCDLSLLDVTNSSFRDVRFENSQVIGINWALASWPGGVLFGTLHFTDCVLNYSSFFGLTLQNATFEKCVARDVDFGEADLTGASCKGTDFTESRFHNTNLTGADFSEAVNYAINPLSNTLSKTTFSLPEAVALLHSLDIILVD